MVDNPCVGKANNAKSDVHGIPRFHDYDIRIWRDDSGSPIGTYINADFNNSDSEPSVSLCASRTVDCSASRTVDSTQPFGETKGYNGIFSHVSNDYMSIEIGTHDEALIANAAHLCKEIANNMLMLDELLTIINEENKLTKELLS